MPRIVFVVSIACCVAALIACSPLPEYARPLVIEDPDYLKKEDVIYYRSLTRADFKGTKPPQGFDHRMAAAICAYIESDDIEPESLKIEYLGTNRGEHRYSINYSELNFRARVDRDCSWWNPANTANRLPESCILQHEQVHFALFEIAAREISRDFRARTFHFSGTDPESLKQSLQEQVRKFYQQRMDELVRQNFEFDEQTSAKFDPLGQQEWLVKVAEKLGDRSIIEQWKCNP